jgi:hypothetical protein
LLSILAPHAKWGTTVRQFARHVACVALAACVIAGCGSSQARRTMTSRAQTAQAPPPHAASDPQRASVGLLPRAAMPLRVGGENPRRNHARCGPRVLFRRLATGVATSPRYEVEGGQVQQTALVFHDARTAKRAFDKLTSRANSHCLRQEARSEVSVEANAEAGPVTEQILNLEPRGQQSASYRMNTFVAGAGRVAIDILINRVGRALSSVSVIWTQAPEGLSFQEALVSRIAARLRQVLA